MNAVESRRSAVHVTSSRHLEARSVALMSRTDPLDLFALRATRSPYLSELRGLLELVRTQPEGYWGTLPAMQAYALPPGLPLRELELSRPTRYALTRAGLARTDRLRSTPLADLMELPGFARARLLDYLGAVVRALEAASAVHLLRELKRRVEALSLEALASDAALAVPALPEPVQLEDLSLPQRVLTCLERAGFLAQPESLRTVKLSDLLLLDAFGKTSLIDYVVAVQQALANEPEVSTPLNQGS